MWSRLDQPNDVLARLASLAQHVGQQELHHRETMQPDLRRDRHLKGNKHKREKTLKGRVGEIIDSRQLRLRTRVTLRVPSHRLGEGGFPERGQTGGRLRIVCNG